MPARAHSTFLDALSKISGTGNFHSEGRLPFFLPEIAVEGVGELVDGGIENPCKSTS